MKWTLISLSALVFLGACNVRPDRVKGRGKGKVTTPGGATPMPGEGESNPVGIPKFVDSNDPLDTYLSVGPFLQKEFDSTQGPGKTVKVYLQVRQENSVEKNIASLKEIIGPLHASIPSALDSALKKGDTTVEFEADVSSLKTSVTMMNIAASGIELSLPQVK